MPRIVIVGGGISGLAAAFRIHQAVPTAEITVLEAADRVGGNVWTDRREGFTVECGPNGFLDAKPSTLQLCRDLGLADRLVPASESSGRNRYVFVGGRLHALPRGLLSLLTTPLLSLRGKIELLAEPWRRKGTGQEESVAAFARRRAGREAADVFVDALVTGIHGGDPELLSAQAAFPRVTGFEADAGSVIRGMSRAATRRRAEAAARGEAPSRQRLWSLRTGLREVIDALCERLPTPPVTGVRVKRVRRDEVGWRVEADGRDAWRADAVVLTSPAYEQAPALADLDPGLADLIGGIAYNRIAVVALAYSAAEVPGNYDGFGYIAPQNTRRDLLGVQWCSAIYPDRAPPGMVLWRALCGGWHRAEVVDWPDERLIAAVRAELRRAMHVTAAPRFVSVVRWPRAIPQYLLGHPRRVRAVMERAAAWPGLFLGGNAYHGVALNDCTEQGERLAAAVAEYLRSRSG